MNYLKHYNLLIERAKNRTIVDEYSEEHHIIPRCLDGSDESFNLVDLFPEEHFVAHQLLVKIYPGNHSLVKAATMMCVNSKNVNRINNKLYGWLRKRLSLAQSESQSGIGNSQYGTKWIHNKELKVSKKISVDEKILVGWELGRVINWTKSESRLLQNECPECGKLKSSLNKFCSLSCSTTNGNKNKVTIFDKYLDDMIVDYKNGMSIYKCLISRDLCGTGVNHTKLSKAVKNRGIV